MNDKRGRLSELSQTAQDSTHSRLLVLRLCLSVSLVGTAVACAVSSVFILQNGEANRFKSAYRAVTEGSVKLIASSYNRLNIGIQELASIYSHNFPHAAEWPNVGWNGFNPTVELLSRSSVVDGMGYMPLIRPEQLASYETYIKGYYVTDEYFDPAVYVPSFMPEGMVWSLEFSTPTITPYHDTTGETVYGSPNKVLVPVTQYTFSTLAGPGLSNFNFHSLEVYGLALDSTIDCVGRNNFTYALTSCGALSDVMALPLSIAGESNTSTEDMAAMFVHPIIPARNKTELVGFAGGALSWRKLLSDVFPAELRPFYIVVESDTQLFTFITENGAAMFKGHGDLHDPHFDEYAMSFELLSHSAALASSSMYKITFYPTKAYATQYFTDQPVWVAVGLVMIFTYCGALFLAYDLLVQRESGEHAAVLDTKRRFVRFISHEIRTPLNTMQLGMKLLEVELAKLLAAILASPSGGLLDLVRQNLSSWQLLTEDIIRNSETAVEVLNDLLNYDKIEMGTLRLEFAPVNVCALLKKVIALMQVQAQHKNIKLELAEESTQLMAAGRATIVGDKQRVEQVVRSLISNALRFTPSDGLVTVTVRTSFTMILPSSPSAVKVVLPAGHTLSQGSIVISVKDSGAGLSEEDVAKIAMRGVRFDADHLLSEQGSGLGLFISKGIIEQHGGRMLVESEGLGKGVTFSAVLPYYEGTQEEPQSVIKDTPSDKATLSLPASAAGPRRMLVVDDSHFSRKMLVRLLTSKGHTCEQAEDGEVAVQTYLEMVERGEPPDAILMDFEMPVMNGPSATARLRELGCACLVVGVTGNVLPHDVAFFLKHGADAVLPKPLILEDFERLLYGAVPPLRLSMTEATGAPLLRVSEKEAPSPRAGTYKVSPLENV